jgi:hypothetical protein
MGAAASIFAPATSEALISPLYRGESPGVSAVDAATSVVARLAEEEPIWEDPLTEEPDNVGA